MKNNYQKYNGDIEIRTKDNLVYITDTFCEKYYYTEDEAKFLCKCLNDIFNKDRVFIYNYPQLMGHSLDCDIASIIRKKIKDDLTKMMLPTNGIIEFEIIGDLIKVTYRWLE